KAAENFWAELYRRYESRRVDNRRPILPPKDIYLAIDELFGQLKNYPRTQVQTATLDKKPGHINFDSSEPPALTVRAQQENPLTAVQAFLLDFNGRVIFCAESAG